MLLKPMVKVDGKANLIIVNLFIHLRQVIHQSHLLSHFFRIFKKLVEIAMVHVISSVDDECCFNSISFLKNKLCNQLNLHLQLVVMYALKLFTFDIFPYQIVYNMWLDVNIHMIRANVLELWKVKLGSCLFFLFLSNSSNYKLLTSNHKGSLLSSHKMKRRGLVHIRTPNH